MSTRRWEQLTQAIEWGTAAVIAGAFWAMILGAVWIVMGIV
jgi:hypothetical protein